MGVPLLDLKAQYQELKTELDAAVFDVMANAAFIGGPKVKELSKTRSPSTAARATPFPAATAPTRSS